jgi:hypothetical protein
MSMEGRDIIGDGPATATQAGVVMASQSSCRWRTLCVVFVQASCLERSYQSRFPSNSAKRTASVISFRQDETSGSFCHSTSSSNSRANSSAPLVRLRCVNGFPARDPPGGSNAIKFFPAVARIRMPLLWWPATPLFKFGLADGVQQRTQSDQSEFFVVNDNSVPYRGSFDFQSCRASCS